jgi:CrcB protein
VNQSTTRILNAGFSGPIVDATSRCLISKNEVQKIVSQNSVQYLIVAGGSALGGVSRFWLSGMIAQRFASTFPVNTLFINISGSFVIGLIAALSAVDSRYIMGASWRNFLMVGVCGGYTTFSSFSLQTLNLAHEGQWLYAGANIVGSVVLCLIGVWAGYLLGQWLR